MLREQPRYGLADTSPLEEAAVIIRYKFDNQKLKDLVKEAGGLNQVCLAYEAANKELLARSTLNSWVEGLNDPSVTRQMRLTYTFGFSVMELITEDPVEDK